MIKNLPADINNYKFIVARMFDGLYWYYTATNDEKEASEIAKEVNGRKFVNVGKEE